MSMTGTKGPGDERRQMAAVEEEPCGLSREVTLAVLPRLYMEEVVTELRRRNISTDTGAAGNCRERLLGILQDVMEQEYHRADTGASSDLDNSLDVLQMTQPFRVTCIHCTEQHDC
ncbi:Hypp8857 [Branchiostoma lanceolatum]|uniref:Hypp8857 protein n=1 Tax=Branchiostoma lanceolatum TaxID=7740 RepID=A0A8J9Z9Y1_BRALA|nr:Hypp8857 [Branchiostoma lanceolatum]